MASSSKKKTTFAKMTRENKVRERQQMKAAKRDARKNAATNPPPEPLSDVPAEDERLKEEHTDALAVGV